MKTQIFTSSIFMMLFMLSVNGQESYQTFTNAGFKVKCGCKLSVNSTFISMAKQQGITNVFAAFVCAENENNPETGVIYNINIYDESKIYKNVTPSGYPEVEKKYLQQYATDLKNSGISYTYTTYQGVSAIEYNMSQQGITTKAIIFIKNKKSFLLQVATRKNLASKFTSFKTSFVIL